MLLDLCYAQPGNWQIDGPMTMGHEINAWNRMHREPASHIDWLFERMDHTSEHMRAGVGQVLTVAAKAGLLAGREEEFAARVETIAFDSQDLYPEDPEAVDPFIRVLADVPHRSSIAILLKVIESEEYAGNEFVPESVVYALSGISGVGFAEQADPVSAAKLWAGSQLRTD